MAAVYLPSRSEIERVARRGKIGNRHADTRRWLLDKVTSPPPDWESRAFLNIPGPVWSISSDTCMTGHLSAPKNIAYDDYGREFVYRQPSNAKELAAIMSADSEEAFSCYRFDGLERWTRGAVEAWHEDSGIIRRWIDAVIGTLPDDEITESLRAYAAYLDSDAFGSYIWALKDALPATRTTT